MSTSGGVPASNSSVYKLLRGHRGNPIVRKNQRLRNAEVESKWSFLQRLLAIEEAHDKRKLVTKKPLLQRTREDDGVDSVKDSSANLADMETRWTHGQVK